MNGIIDCCPCEPSLTKQFDSIFDTFSTDTMIERSAFIDNLRLAHRVANSGDVTIGAIVECGTWRGGMAAGLMTVCGPERDYYFFDSFRGLPPAGIEDGEAAVEWQRNTTGPRYFGNCTATREEFVDVVNRVGFPAERVKVYEGFFNEVFPRVAVPPIAVLRLDADWYESTMLCLEKFWDLVVPCGVIIVDDYYDWEGCRKAVHRFLAMRGAVEAIRITFPGQVCYLAKA